MGLIVLILLPLVIYIGLEVYDRNKKALRILVVP